MDFFCGLDSTGEGIARPTEAPDQRLIYAFIPGDRNIENYNYGMYVKNPLTNGDGTIKSEDADSMAGVFDDENGSFYCGEGYLAGAEPVGAPIVKESAPDGKLIIKEGWNLDEYSFIIRCNKVNYNLSTYFITGTNWDQERLYLGANTDNIVSGFALMSNDFLKFIGDNGSEYSVLKFNPGVPRTDTSLIFPFQNYNFSNSEVGECFFYKAIMSENELRDELAKIKSGNYDITNIGVIEPVPQAQRRRDEFGNYKEGVFIESQSTDIQLVETNKRVTTTDHLGVIRTDNINSQGVITGAGGIADIAGYMRATAATGATPTNPVKVVIEKL